MNNSTAKKYAEALYSLLYKEELVKYQVATKELVSFFAENDDVKKFLLSETISLNDKEVVVKKICDDFKLDYLANFVLIVIRNHRFNYFNAIVKEFNYMINELNGVEEGIVYSAIKLSDEQIKKIEKSISDKIGKKVELTNKISSQLIGGVKVSIRDMVFDGSVKTKLENMKKEILGR